MATTTKRPTMMNTDPLLELFVLTSPGKDKKKVDCQETVSDQTISFKDIYLSVYLLTFSNTGASISFTRCTVRARYTEGLTWFVLV